MEDMPAKNSKGKVQRRLADIMGQTEGSAGLLTVLQTRNTPDADELQNRSPIAGSVLHVAIPIPTGAPLGPHNHHLSSKRVEDPEDADVEEELVAISKDFD